MYPVPPIKDCTPEQEALIKLELDHLESNPGDPEGNTTRAVYRDGRKSSWFSHCWDSLNWENVKPK